MQEGLSRSDLTTLISLVDEEKRFIRQVYGLPPNDPNIQNLERVKQYLIDTQQSSTRPDRRYSLQEI